GSRDQSDSFSIAKAPGKESRTGAISVVLVNSRSDRSRDAVARADVATRADRYIELIVRIKRDILEGMRIRSTEFGGACIWQSGHDNSPVMRRSVPIKVNVPIDLSGFGDVDVCRRSDGVKNNVMRVSQTSSKVMDRRIAGRSGANDYHLSRVWLRYQEVS